MITKSDGGTIDDEDIVKNMTQFRNKTQKEGTIDVYWLVGCTCQLLLSTWSVSAAVLSPIASSLIVGMIAFCPIIHVSRYGSRDVFTFNRDRWAKRIQVRSLILSLYIKSLRILHFKLLPCLDSKPGRNVLPSYFFLVLKVLCEWMGKLFFSTL